MAAHGMDTETGFRLEGTYTESDLDALARFSVAQFLDRRIGKATVSATILLAVAAVLFRSWPLAIFGFLGVLLLSALVRYVVLPRRLIRHARQMPGTLAPRVFSLEGSELRHTVDGHEQTLSTHSIRRIVLHKTHLFILLKPSGCLMLPLQWIHPPLTIEAIVKSLVTIHED